MGLLPHSLLKKMLGQTISESSKNEESNMKLQ